MTASQKPDAEHAPLTSPAAGGSGSTGHDKAVRAVMDASDCSRAVDVNGTPYCEAHWVGWLSDVDACVRAERIAQEVLAALRAALAAGDADVAEALGGVEDVIYGVPVTEGPDPLIMTTYDGTARQFARWTIRTPWTEA